MPSAYPLRVPGPAGGPRLGLRVSRSAAAVDAARSEISAWLENRRGDETFRIFGSHFTVLETVLEHMVSRLLAELPPSTEGVGRGYERCRRVDRGVATLRRLFWWYAAKYDQRRTGAAALLAAADKLALSCWAAGFAALGRTPPTGPLCFVDNRADALAKRRCEVPGELRPVADDPLAELIGQLPIPVIALPESALRESWWLVLVAHEVGHHVLLDLRLEEPVRAAVREAAGPELEGSWLPWHGEAFADLYSVLMVGSAGAWAVGELQFGTTAHLLRPRAAYPAPLVRLAFIGEALRGLGFESDVPAAADVKPDADPNALAHLEVLPGIVRALLDMPFGGGTLRSLASADLTEPGRKLRSWAEQLSRPDPLIATVDNRLAPRVLVAAAVRAHLMVSSTADAGRAPVLHGNVIDVLARSGEPGLLSAAAGPDLGDLPDRLADVLFEEATSGEPA